MSDWPVKVGVVCLLLCVLLDLAKANTSTGELVTDEHSDYSAISEKRNRIVFLRENRWKLPPEDEPRLLSLELLSRIDVPSRDLVQRYLLAREYAQAKMLLSYSELKDSPQLRALYWSLELLADDEQMPFAMQRLNDCQRAFNSADCAELLRVMSARNLSLGNFNEAVDFSNAIEQVAVDERSALLLSQDRRRFFKAMLFSGELRVATRTFVKALLEYRKADVPEESIINLELDWVDYTLGTDPVSIGPGAYLSPNTILASAFRRIAQLESPAARYQQVYRYIVILGQLGSNPRAGYAGKPLRKARAMLLQLFGEMSIPQDHQALGFVLLGDSFVQNRRYDDA